MSDSSARSNPKTISPDWGLPGAIPDDPRLLPIVKDFMGRLEKGERPNIEEYIAKHPEFADSLRRCLEGLDLIYRAVGGEASSPRGSRAAAPPHEYLRDPLGDFRIVRELGRGGMGVVYEAVQLSLGRRVALKVLPFAATLQPKQLQRFLNEAQAAAQLHHANIVPVFAVGCDRGVHYYAMQLIEGLSLADMLSRLRRDAGVRPEDEMASSHLPDPTPTFSSGSQSPPVIAPKSQAAIATQDDLSARMSTMKPPCAARLREPMARTASRFSGRTFPPKRK